MDTIQQLALLIEKPEMVNQEHIPMLKEVLLRYPYAQPLHLLMAKAAARDPEKETFITKAAFYTNGLLLHDFLNKSENRVQPAGHHEEAQTETAGEIEEIFEEIQEVPDYRSAEEPEIFEEIGEIDIHQYGSASPQDGQPPHASGETTEVPSTPEKHSGQELTEEDLILESLANADFFAFENNFQPEETTESSLIQETENNIASEDEKIQVSKYHDEQLPYTFLWWLSKTRKEHQDIFQPYAAPKNNPVAGEKKNITSELQQQYVEHIFHIQTPFEVDDHLAQTEIFEPRHAKEAQIIEKFIKQDPQIKPPKAEQIDNENKAKKSAEDHYDLVSETLAKIYIEQMLYHKAIDTYKKLSLKYPEKSRYFADLIRSIEKKI